MDLIRQNLLQLLRHSLLNNLRHYAIPRGMALRARGAGIVHDVGNVLLYALGELLLGGLRDDGVADGVRLGCHFAVEEGVGEAKWVGYSGGSLEKEGVELESLGVFEEGHLWRFMLGRMEGLYTLRMESPIDSDTTAVGHDVASLSHFSQSLLFRSLAGFVHAYFQTAYRSQTNAIGRSASRVRVEVSPEGHASHVRTTLRAWHSSGQRETSSP